MALFKEVVDLSHELFNNMAGVSATSMAAFWPVETHGRSSTNSQGELSSASGMWLLSEHISTHFDTPYHFDPDGLTADKYPLERLILPGHLLDLTHKQIGEAITRQDFEQAVLGIPRVRSDERPHAVHHLAHRLPVFGLVRIALPHALHEVFE